MASSSRSKRTPASSGKGKGRAQAWPYEPPPLAWDLKHLASLRYPLPLLCAHANLQQNNTSGSTGSSLWLSGQVTAAYIQASADDYFRKVPAERAAHGRPAPRALELGAGVGLLSVLLAALGWDVLTTDIEPSFSQVLAPNVAQNQPSEGAGSLAARVLDWTAEDGAIIDAAGAGAAAEPFDLIITTDTVYAGEYVRPLFKTIKLLYTPGRTRVLLALERRDPVLAQRALDTARDEYGFRLCAIDASVLADSVRRFANPAWTAQDLEDIELWELSAG